MSHFRVFFFCWNDQIRPNTAYCLPAKLLRPSRTTKLFRHEMMSCARKWAHTWTTTNDNNNTQKRMTNKKMLSSHATWMRVICVCVFARRHLWAKWLSNQNPFAQTNVSKPEKYIWKSAFRDGKVRIRGGQLFFPDLLNEFNGLLWLVTSRHKIEIISSPRLILAPH